MNQTKTKIGLLLLTVATVLFTVMSAFAQTNLFDVSVDPSPSSKESLWKWGIAVVAPLVVTGIKFIVPKIPTLLLPVSTPFIGMGLGLLLNKLAGLDLSWIDMTQAGALAVFVRETVDQAIKARTNHTSNK